jgi:hypothetical protein
MKRPNKALRRRSVSEPRHDISHHYALKAAFEQILGPKAWQELKECTSVTKWRSYVLKAIRAIRIAIRESVRVRDEEWFESIDENLRHGEELAKSAKDFDELISGFAATLLRNVFWQGGMCPVRSSAGPVTLEKKHWRLDGQRSVQVVQTLEQREAAFWSRKQREIGVQPIMDLHAEYGQSRSRLPFSEWCKARGS